MFLIKTKEFLKGDVETEKENESFCIVREQGAVLPTVDTIHELYLRLAIGRDFPFRVEF